jgi:VIT1/CCC1 family predicted Fe2+/Mn2+ transporter
MPATPHIEKHFSGSQLVRDVVIGMADGLTVPFALAAGLSGAVDATRIVVTAGMAEIAAGSIAMGLGGFLAARGDAEHYHAELAREEREIREIPEAEVREVEEIFGQYGLEPALVAPVVAAFKAKPSVWVDFMMRFELGLERPDPTQALKTAGTIAGAYILGGLVPLAPYFVAETNAAALWPSVAVTLVALGMFGWVKGKFTTGRVWRGAIETMLLGGAAAFAAFSLARLFS